MPKELGQKLLRRALEPGGGKPIPGLYVGIRRLPAGIVRILGTVTPPFNMDTFSAFVHNKGGGDERGVKKNSAPLRGTFFTYNTTKNQIVKSMSRREGEESRGRGRGRRASMRGEGALLHKGEGYMEDIHY